MVRGQAIKRVQITIFAVVWTLFVATTALAQTITVENTVTNGVAVVGYYQYDGSTYTLAQSYPSTTGILTHIALASSNPSLPVSWAIRNSLTGTNLASGNLTISSTYQYYDVPDFFVEYGTHYLVINYNYGANGNLQGTLKRSNVNPYGNGQQYTSINNGETWTTTISFDLVFGVKIDTTPTSTPTASPTPTATPSPTIAPTLVPVVTNTPTPTIAPTATIDPTPWCHQFDFRQSSHGWGVDYGAQYVTGSGWQPNDPTYSYDSMFIYKTFAEAYITRISTIVTGGFYTGGAYFYYWDAVYPNPADEVLNAPSNSIQGDMTVNAYADRIGVGVDSQLGDLNPFNGYIYMTQIRGIGFNPFDTDNCEVIPTPTPPTTITPTPPPTNTPMPSLLYNPVYGGDRIDYVDGFSTFAGFSAGSSVWYANDSTDVHAIDEGEVWSIDPLRSYNCESLVNDTCQIVNTEIDVYLNEVSAELSEADLNRASLVTVKGRNYYWFYIVNNAEAYVKLGTYVAGGCVLGETLSGFTVIKSTDSPTVNGTTIPIGVATLEAGSAPCDTPLQGEGKCLNSSPYPAKDDKNRWQYRGRRLYTDGMVELASGVSMYQLMSGFQPDTAYYIYMRLAGNGTLSVDLGDETQSVSVNNSNTRDFTVQFAGAEETTTLEITDTAGNVRVQYVCIGVGEFEYAPSSCYFQNHDFRGGYDVWSVSNIPSEYLDGGSKNSLASVGTVLLFDQSAISQSIALYSNSATVADYRLDITLLEGTSDGTVNIIGLGSSVSLPVTAVESSTTLSHEFSVTSETIGTFTLTADTTDTAGNMVLDSVCIAPLGGGTFPGYEGDEKDITYGDGDDEVVIEVCERIGIPNNYLNVARWIQWASSGFECAILPVLSDIWTGITGIASSIKDSTAWASVVSSDFGLFIGGIVDWIGSWLRNITSHPYIQIAINTIYSFWVSLLPLLGAFGNIIAQFVDFLGDIWGDWNAISSAWNTAPIVAIPVQPSCDNDVTSHWFCLAIWIMDNTLWATGSMGELFLYLAGTVIVSFGIMFAIEAGINAFRDANGG